ncbi:MAG: methionine--tRNA ligase [Candidatus Zixiibacteriota bacterium]
MPDAPRPIFITTPIYYVNDKPHIGHAYTTIVADYLTRALRLLGHEVFFLTGTDEHGAKVAEVARANGMEPKAWCDLHAQHFKDAWKRLDIEYNYFVRTTDQRHEAGVARLLERLHDATDPDGKPVIYEDEYTGLYCLGCEKFITGKELVDGLCPNHLTKPQELRERNYFFRLSAFLPEVQRRISEGSIRVLPEERRNEVLGLFKQGLEDFSISREREKVDWGIPIPWDPTQNAYVWVDALPNYITAIGYGDDPASFARWWTDASIIHIMAKDILKFHAVYWPAMLLAVGERPPQGMFIHGYFTVNGQKMSKSLRNTLDPHRLVDQFGADGTRYLLLTPFPFGMDGDLKADAFVPQYNADLANDLGNLVSRVIALIEKHFGGRQPCPVGIDWENGIAYRLQMPVHSCTHDFAMALRSRIWSFEDDGPDLDRAIRTGMELVRETNRFVEEHQPWNLAKMGRRDELATVLSVAAEAIRRVAIVLSPAIPNKSLEILRALGFENPSTELSIGGLSPVLDGNARGLCPGPFHLDGPIFPRLEKPESTRTERITVSESSTPENVITIDEFKKAQLRTAEVIAAERVEGANRLLKLQIAIGEERRQIVAGIAEHYKPEDLIGKTIIVVANLQPATVRGVASQGMLLAASKGKTLRLLTADGPLESGATIS